MKVDQIIYELLYASDDRDCSDEFFQCLEKRPIKQIQQKEIRMKQLFSISVFRAYIVTLGLTSLESAII